MKKNLQFLFEHKTLTKEKAKEVLVNIGKGMYNEHEVTAFMTVYLMRSITTVSYTHLTLPTILRV